MDLQADINWIKNQLDSVTDPDLIKAFKSLLNYRNKKSQSGTPDWWEELSAEEKADIEEGIQEADRGELISAEEVYSKIRAKLEG